MSGITILTLTGPRNRTPDLRKTCPTISNARVDALEQYIPFDSFNSKRLNDRKRPVVELDLSKYPPFGYKGHSLDFHFSSES